MAEKEVSVHYGELAQLELTCSHCGTKFTLDVSRHDLPPIAGDRPIGRQCPVCLGMFPEGTQEVLLLYQKFHSKATQGNLTIHFRVKVE